MASQYGIDVGEAYRTAAQVKGARQQNRLRQMKIDQAEQERRNARQRAKTLNKLRERIVSGDDQQRDQAKRALVTFAPEEGKKMLDAFSQMDEQRRKEAQRQVDQVATILNKVRNSQNPEQAYQQALQVLPEDENLPAEYDENRVRFMIAKAQETEKALANPESFTVGGEDRVYQGGEQIESTQANNLIKQRRQQQADRAEERRDRASMDASDESLMHRATIQAMTGMDISKMASGEVNKMLDEMGQPKRDKMLAIAARASEIRQQNPDMSRLQAVAQARRESDPEANVPDYGGGEDLDGVNLINRYKSQ